MIRSVDNTFLNTFSPCHAVLEPGVTEKMYPESSTAGPKEKEVARRLDSGEKHSGSGHQKEN